MTIDRDMYLNEPPESNDYISEEEYQEEMRYQSEHYEALKQLVEMMNDVLMDGEIEDKGRLDVLRCLMNEYKEYY